MDKMRPKFRSGIIIAKREINAAMRHERLDLASVIQQAPQYIGYTDIWEDTARLYIFGSKEAAETAAKEAKKIGFETCGTAAESIYIKNDQLQRPHLKYLKGHAYFKELCK